MLPATWRTRTAEVLAARPGSRTKVHRCSGAADGGRHDAGAESAGDAEVVVATWQHMLSLLSYCLLLLLMMRLLMLLLLLLLMVVVVVVKTTTTRTTTCDTFSTHHGSGRGTP